MTGLRRHALATLMVVSAGIAACNAAAPPRRVDIDALVAEGRSFDGRKVVVRGCLGANPHGLILSSCPSGRQAVVVFPSDGLDATQASFLHSEALRSRIRDRRPLAVTMCGTYRQTPEGRDKWMDVDAFAIDGRTAASASCRL